MNRQLAWAVSGTLVAVLAVIAVWVSLGSPDAVLDDTPEPPEQRPARGEETIVVEIPSGHTAEQIGDELFRRGVITSSRQFQTLVGLLGYEGRLVVGTYDFEPGMLTMDVIERIRRGVTSEIVVTIPEGWQAAEIFARVAEQSPISVADLEAAAADPAVARGTLALGRPDGVSLEGYLFPSTYVISRVATGADVVRQMLRRFDDQITIDMRAEIAAAGRPLHLLLTIASIVEREAVLPAERALIASVFWNRIDNDLPLQADRPCSTRGQDPDSVALYGHWKSPLTAEDLQCRRPGTVCFRRSASDPDRLAGNRVHPRRLRGGDAVYSLFRAAAAGTVRGRPSRSTGTVDRVRSQ